MKRLFIILSMMIITTLSHAAQVKADKLYYTWVDKVNVRATPSLSGKVVQQLQLGEDVTYTGKQTKDSTVVTLQGKKYDRPWAQIVTATGKTGWIHAGTLQKKKVLICWLTKVNVRSTPDLKAKAVASLNENDEVEYLGYISDNKEKVTLRGKTYNEVFYKVKMKDGAVVWVYGATVKNKIEAPEEKKDKVVTVGGSEADYTSLKEAIADATPGTTIQIEEGTYNSAVAIQIEEKQDIKIIGMGKVELICTSQYDDVLTIMNSRDIRLINVTLKHNIPVRESCSGMVITLNSCKDITIEDCDINGCGWMGIYSYQTDGLHVKDCYLHDNYEYAMNFYKNDMNILIEGCRIENNGGGIIIDWGGTEMKSDDSIQDWLVLKNNSWGDNGVQDHPEHGGGEEDYNEYEGEEGY